IDVLINNAGVFRSNRLIDTSLDEFERVMAVNCRGVFLGMRAVARVMREAGSGSIVNISSLAGLKGAAGAFAYGTSKWAVRGMTKTAAVELGRRGIRVNSIHPGVIDTDMAAQLPGGTDQMARGVPLGRIADAQEVANLALYLASDESSYSTGAEFVVDGGLYAR
ncbi:MAG: SDR family NAD(P)-dependent oxidoreductase, partial [Gammaproteobacteria bacterium]